MKEWGEVTAAGVDLRAGLITGWGGGLTAYTKRVRSAKDKTGWGAVVRRAKLDTIT